MKGQPRNLPASVAARLLNRAKETGDDYQRLLVSFCFERFLYRLGLSEARDRFVLKGAMLFRLWSDEPLRATRDLDLLRKGDPSPDEVRSDLRLICEAAADPDGVSFDVDSIRIEPLGAGDEFVGLRVRLVARCGSAVLPLQIDMGLGDDVWPKARQCTYPVLLEFPPAEVWAYPPEAVVAEKVEAMIVHAERNSRIKDFFDLRYLARRFEFDRATLFEALRRTLALRETHVPDSVPVGLTLEYWSSELRPAQVRAFARRAGLTLEPNFGTEILRALRPFLLPLLDDLRIGQVQDGCWRPGGPWRSRKEP